MPDSLILSTDELAPRERVPAWHDWMNRLFLGLGSDLYGDTEFDGHLHTAHAGDVIMTRLEASRHRVMRTQPSGHAGDLDYLKIVAPWQGCAAVEQHGRQAWVHPGGWAIYDTTGNYEVANPQRSQHLIVMLPKEALIERGLRLDPLMGRHVGGHSGIARIALDTMRSTFRELPGLGEESARGAGALILELVRLSLQELAGRASGATQREAFRDRIRDFVGQHLRDPDLTVDHIARRLNCSKRHLYNAFADEDDTLAHYILRRRLQASMRDLTQTGGPQRTITDIALSWGFTNIAHFSRVFHQHTGLPPSEFRQSFREREQSRP